MTSIQSKPRLTPLSTPVKTPEKKPEKTTTVRSLPQKPETLEPKDQLKLKGQPEPQTPKTVTDDSPPPELKDVEKLQNGLVQKSPVGVSRKNLELSLERGIRRLEVSPELRGKSMSLAKSAHDIIEGNIVLTPELHASIDREVAQLQKELSQPPQGLEMVTKRAVGINADSKNPIKSFDSLEQAIEAANARNAGNEAIVAYKDDQGATKYALIELNTSTKPELLKQVFGNTAVYHTDGNRNLTVVQEPKELSARVENTTKLVQAAINDKASGLDIGRTPNNAANNYIAYKNNMETTMRQLNDTQGQLVDERQKLESQLKIQEAASPLDKATIAKTKQALEQNKAQSTQLHTYQKILIARMSILPESNDLIPGAELKTGEYRRSPSKARDILNTQLNMIDSQLMVTTDPKAVASLKEQRQLVVNELTTNVKTQQQILQASYKTKVRVGALATMHQGLDDAKARLGRNMKALDDLNQKIQTAKGPELDTLQKQKQLLETEIKTDRKQLIDLMKSEIKTFESHVNIKSEGGKKAIAFLKSQVQELEALGQVDAQKTLDLINKTQSELLKQVKSAAQIFDGLTPKEATLLEGIDTKTNQYIADYKVAKKKLAGIQGDLDRKINLVQNPPLSPIGKASITKLDEVYLGKIQKLLKEAKGGNLEELKKLYGALAMSKNPDIDSKLRARIDIDKVKARIQELSQQEDVQKAFAKAKQEAIQEVFGNGAADKLANHLLSPEFREFYSMLSKDEQKTLLAVELGKLSQLDPAKAAQVKQALVGEELTQNAGKVLKGVSKAERKAAFDKLFGVVNPINTAKDKSTKAADAMATAFEALSPDEMAKLNDPNKLYKALAGKLSGMGENGQEALKYMKGLQKTGAFGAFMAVAASVATTGKMPAALQNGDIKSIADLGSSVLGVAGNAKNVATLFGFTDEVFQGASAASKLAKMGKVLKVAEFLGPVGDVISMGIDGYGSYQDFKDGDTVGGFAKGAGALAGGAGAVAGVMILAGSTGPGAPIVLVGAAIIGGVAWGVDALWGESEEETYLRKLGVLKTS